MEDYSCQPLNIFVLSDVRQTKMHTSEPLILEHRFFKVEIAIEKIKTCKSPDIPQIPREIIQAGYYTLCSEIRKLINSVWNKEEMPQQ